MNQTLITCLLIAFCNIWAIVGLSQENNTISSQLEKNIHIIQRNSLDSTTLKQTVKSVGGILDSLYKKNDISKNGKYFEGVFNIEGEPFLVVFCSLAENVYHSQYLNTVGSKLIKEIHTNQQNAFDHNSSTEFLSSLECLLDSIYGKDNLLKNGKLFEGYFTIDGSPFLFEKENTGTITFNEITYSPVNLRYDIYKQKVIGVFQNQLMLNDYYIDTFTIKNRKFINYSKISNQLNGYYELIFECKDFSLVASWAKTAGRPTHSSKRPTFSKATRKLYLIESNKVQAIKKKKDLYRIFKLSKKEIRKVRKVNFVRLSEANNHQLTAIISIINKLN